MQSANSPMMVKALQRKPAMWRVLFIVQTDDLLAMLWAQELLLHSGDVLICNARSTILFVVYVCMCNYR
jgi:hypothetical protein